MGLVGLELIAQDEMVFRIITLIISYPLRYDIISFIYCLIIFQNKNNHHNSELKFKLPFNLLIRDCLVLQFFCIASASRLYLISMKFLLQQFIKLLEINSPLFKVNLTNCVSFYC